MYKRKCLRVHSKNICKKDKLKSGTCFIVDNANLESAMIDLIDNYTDNLVK